MLKKKLLKVAIWLIVLNLGIAASLLGNFKQAKADELPTIQFEKAFAKGSAEIADVKVPVDLSEDSTDVITVKYAVIGGTAVENTDYTISGDTLTIPAGELSTDIDLSVIDNHLCGRGKTIEIGLEDPTNANLGIQTEFTYKILQDDCDLQTTLVIDPASPDGKNGWYKTTPSITLTVVDQATIYYQWDAKDCSSWLKYTGVLSAPEGDHTLYYYSEKHHHKEKVKSAVIKVDTLAPPAPQVTANVDDNAVVHLSWSADASVASYEVWRTDAPLVIANLDGTQLTYSDNDVVRGISYEYNVLAIDEAGNKSKVIPISILVPALAATTTSVNQTTIEYIPVYKSIGDGVSTTNTETPTPEVAGVTNTPETPAVTNNEESNHRNWNQLLLAISILIIAIGAAIGGYYGYEWFMTHRDKDESQNPPKGKSRW